MQPAVFHWGRDPLFAVHAQLFIRDVLGLEEATDVKDAFFYGTHPITRVEICGIVVRVDEYNERISFVVDDGTGTLPCIVWASAAATGAAQQPSRCALGDCVTMRGRLGTFREHRQLTVHAIRIERDPNAEALHWLSVLSLKRSTYDVPCVLLTGTAGGMAPAHVHDREGGGGTKRLTDDDAAPAAKRRAMGRGHPSVT
eukprot:Opistho-2@21255